MARSGFLCEILRLKRKASVLFAEGLLPDGLLFSTFSSGRIRMSSNFSILEMVVAVCRSRLLECTTLKRNGGMRKKASL